jgi:hypothetical protein
MAFSCPNSTERKRDVRLVTTVLDKNGIISDTLLLEIYTPAISDKDRYDNDTARFTV